MSSVININQCTTSSALSATTSPTLFAQNKLTKKSRRINLRYNHHYKNKTTKLQIIQQNLQHLILQIDSIKKTCINIIYNYYLDNFSFKLYSKKNLVEFKKSNRRNDAKSLSST